MRARATPAAGRGLGWSGAWASGLASVGCSKVLSTAQRLTLEQRPPLSIAVFSQRNLLSASAIHRLEQSPISYAQARSHDIP